MCPFCLPCRTLLSRDVSQVPSGQGLPHVSPSPQNEPGGPLSSFDRPGGLAQPQPVLIPPLAQQVALSQACGHCVTRVVPPLPWRVLEGNRHLRSQCLLAFLHTAAEEGWVWADVAWRRPQSSGPSLIFAALTASEHLEPPSPISRLLSIIFYFS